MHVCTKDEVLIPVTQSSVESIRNGREVSWMPLRGFQNKRRISEKLLVREKSVTTYSGVTSSDNSQYYSVTMTFSRFGIQRSVRRYWSLP